MSDDKNIIEAIQDEPQPSKTQLAFEWIHAIIMAIVFVVLLLTFVFRMINVDGTSMLDTLKDQDKVIVTNYYSPPENGDIVVISHGQEYAKPIIKRVIATEGQTIDINFETNQVIVDGVILDEPYIKEPTEKKGDVELPLIVPEDYVFVMGDNRNGSTDSRFHMIGLINTDDIIGKAECVIFPFSDIKSLA